jgi:para-nitrobenzyl esterase
MNVSVFARTAGEYFVPLFPLLTFWCTVHVIAAPALRTSQIRTPNGILEGVISADGKVRTFKGIPYAAPPVGPLRWKPPRPAPSWTGIRKASEYGARCMQGRIYSDMIFQDNGPSEDCLTLNLWMPAQQQKTPLPVMVWIYGGGFKAGSSSEPRQDGGNLSKQGVLVVSMNYRLGVFGFFAHPDLAKESRHNAAGNYGLMDQLAALEWVHQNIALFGGDPQNVTIFGESAGSFSVSALMASPLARELFQRAIGESGAFFSNTLLQKSLADTEQQDLAFARSAFGTDSLETLRAKPASELLAGQLTQHESNFSPNIDGYYLPESVTALFAAGKQSHIPLLAGWNADEQSPQYLLKDEPSTAQNFIAWVRQHYGAQADAILKLYPAATDEQAKISARDLASDRFLGFATWKWLDMQLKTGGGQPVYRYHFEQAPPPLPNEPAARGAYHSAEIEYVFNVLGHHSRPWTPEDRALSDQMAAYWSNFAKTGDPNGDSLPHWPRYDSSDHYRVMHLTGSGSRAAADTLRPRYLLLDEIQGPDFKLVSNSGINR